MRFGGSGWQPASRRNRRRGRGPKRSTQEGAGRTFVVLLIVFAVLLIVFAVLVLGLVLLFGFLAT
ncbi:MAG TPA: hypothetical protein VKA73_05635 [Rubrobacter sp.]|nr:hypothetical protein [Rubrobacter sp.]